MTNMFFITSPGYVFHGQVVWDILSCHYLYYTMHSVQWRNKDIHLITRLVCHLFMSTSVFSKIAVNTSINNNFIKIQRTLLRLEAQFLNHNIEIKYVTARCLWIIKNYRLSAAPHTAPTPIIRKTHLLRMLLNNKCSTQLIPLHILCTT